MGDNSTTTIQGCTPVLPTNSSFSEISWVIAMVCAIFAALLNNLGVNFQKLAWTRMQKGKQNYKAIWGVGMTGIILASVLDFVALAFGPQSVIAPLGALTMVVNGFVAPVMHGERVGFRVFIATVIIVAGCGVAVSFASHVNVICSPESLFGLFLSYTFLAYALVVVAMTCVMGIVIRYAEATKRAKGPQCKEYRRIYKLHRVSYAFLSGLFGAQSVLFARAVDQLVVSSTAGQPFFLTYGQTYGLLFGMIACIVIQIWMLNHGLARFESIYNVPVFTGTFIIVVALGGGVVYGEFSGFSPIQAVLFPVGVAICVSGVFALACCTAGPPVTSMSEGAENGESHASSDDEARDVVASVGDDQVHLPANIHVGMSQRSSLLRIRSGGWTPYIVDEIITPKARKSDLNLIGVIVDHDFVEVAHIGSQRSSFHSKGHRDIAKALRRASDGGRRMSYPTTTTNSQGVEANPQPGVTKFLEGRTSMREFRLPRLSSPLSMRKHPTTTTTTTTSVSTGGSSISAKASPRNATGIVPAIVRVSPEEVHDAESPNDASKVEHE